MKKMINMMFIAMVAVSMLTLPSCDKNSAFSIGGNAYVAPNGQVAVNANVGFRVAGTWINLSFGTGGGYYYPYSAYGSYVYPNGATGNPITMCYVKSASSPTNIVVYDANNNPIGTADCVSNVDWKIANQYSSDLRNYLKANGIAVVQVEWDNHWTNGPWSGHIRF